MPIFKQFQSKASLRFWLFNFQRPLGGDRIAVKIFLLFLSSEIDITCWDTDPVVDDEDD